MSLQSVQSVQPNPSYDDLIKKIEVVKKHISKIQKEMNLADNIEELSQLNLKLSFYEDELMVIEDYIDRIIDRGRGDYCYDEE